MMYIPTLHDMRDAQVRVKPYVHRTPVLTSQYLNDLTGAEPVSYTISEPTRPY